MDLAFPLILVGFIALVFGIVFRLAERPNHPDLRVREFNRGAAVVDQVLIIGGLAVLIIGLLVSAISWVVT